VRRAGLTEAAGGDVTIPGVGTVETDARRLAEAERGLADVSARLRDTSTALLEANQELARIPVLESRLEELRAATARLEDELERARAKTRALEGSRSWRLLAPLRRLRASVRRR